VSANVDSFLDRFFGEGNEISLEQARTTPDLSTLIDGIDPDLNVPAIVPRRLNAERVEWFVLCGDDAALRRTQSELLAFIGPTYGRWDGIRASLEATDPVEAAVRDFCDGRAIRFRTQGTDEFKECWAAIRLMRKVWAQRPEQRPEQIRTGAALVREFELAAAAGDTRTAAEALGALRRRGLLGAENVRFLEIRSLAAEGRWAEISTADDLRDLARIRRPWLVTEDILTALYRTHVTALESEGGVAQAIAAVRAIVPRLAEFFSSRGPLRAPDVVKLFALQFAAADPANAERIDELLGLDGLSASDRRWISAIAEEVRPVPVTPVPSARDLLSAGDIDGAFALALPDKDVRAVEVLIECAFELQTLDAADRALVALEALGSADRETLVERRLIAVAVEHLRALAEPSEVGEPAAPYSWTGWFDRLLNDPAWRAAEAVAACGELEYAATDVVDFQAATNLAGLITTAADSDRRHVVRDALPCVVGWLERQGFELALVRPIHAAILTVLALDSAWGDAALEVAYNSTEAVLAGGVDAAGYGELLEELSLIWDRMAARRHVTWLADLLELLELFPGPRQPLIGFAAASLGPVRGALPRVAASTLDGLRDSLAGIGASELAAGIPSAPTVPETEDLPRLDGRLVGIYTLTPQVAVRAKQAIERRFPGVRVVVDSSHVSTPSLEHLAASADYLIVSIRSAKHAATDAIDRCRPRNLPTIIPGGRGSSRMVEALVASLS
jgi:hypothetical protein